MEDARIAATLPASLELHAHDLLKRDSRSHQRTQSWETQVLFFWTLTFILVKSTSRPNPLFKFKMSQQEWYSVDYFFSDLNMQLSFVVKIPKLAA